MIDKWLKAGVMEEGRIHYPEDASPQGGVISPLLANIYLHEVLDVWYEKTVKPLTGYYNYHGIPCNYRALARLLRGVRRAWRYWLSRRSQRASIPWDEFDRRYALPQPRIVHGWV